MGASTSLTPRQDKIRNIYLAISIGCAIFILLTMIAMFTYAGGTFSNPAAPGYSFTQNFLSNLGMFTAPSGRANLVSAALFSVALGAAGVSLVIFFLIFPRLFSGSLLQRMLALTGTALGVMAGASFTGIAFTPADVARSAHIQFVMWAFRLFPLAVLFYVPVMFLDKRYPKVYAWVFAIFSLMLIGYYLLLTNGPRISSPGGLVIQVVGQKVIAYASIASVLIQSLGAYRFLATKPTAIHPG